jgi:hypothetical protein
VRVDSIELGRIAGSRARGPLPGRLLQVGALAAGLLTAPMLAGTARAQRTGVIQATAYVISSYLGAGFRQDSTWVSGRPSARPVARQITIAGVGVVEVETGVGAETPITSQVIDRRGRMTVSIQVSFAGT